MTTLIKDRRKRGLTPVLTSQQGLTPELLDIFTSWPARFSTKVTISEGCWEWQASKTRNGYGRYGLGGREAGWGVSHRVAYRFTYGEIPEGLHLDHLCGNPSCVRPDHLEPVTQAENIRRGAASNASGWCRSGRHRWTVDNILTEPDGTRRCRPCRDERERDTRPPSGNAPGDRTHCPQGHEYSPENTRVRKNGHRDCKECARIAARRRYWATKEATSGSEV